MGSIVGRVRWSASFDFRLAGVPPAKNFLPVYRAETGYAGQGRFCEPFADYWD